jgi:PAS domain S-box-containing protein
MRVSSPVFRKLLLPFGSAILILLAVGALSFRGMVASSGSESWVRHTHQVLNTLTDWLLAMETMESSARGFILTGDERYLASFSATVAAAEHDQRAALALTVDNPVEQRLIPAIAALAQRKILLVERTIALRRSMGLAAAAASIQGGAPQTLMEAFRQELRKSQDEEMRLLLRRDAMVKRDLWQTKTILILGTVLGLLVAAIAAWSARRDGTRGLFAAGELKDSEERYRLLLDGVRDYAIFTLDPVGQVVTWNAGAERINGYKAAQIIGRDYSCLFSRRDAERGRPAEVLRAAEAGGHYEEQALRARQDGSLYLAHAVYTALRTPAGDLRGFSEFSRDISESKESVAKYRGLLEAAPDAMVVVNTAGELVLLNVQAEKQFGYDRGELVGQKVTNIIPVGFAERLLLDGTRTAAEALAQVIGTGIELIARRKDGSEFPIEIMLSPLESAEGILVTAAIRDVTVRKAAEANLLAKVAELSRSNEELAQFAYIASHDLQEPLRMVASYTQLLARRYKGKLDADADEFIAYAVDGASRMQRLIQDLLAYSRVGTTGSSLLATSSEEALQQALMNLYGAIEESGALVTSDHLPIVCADAVQLTQLFQNLVGNAIKYQDAGVPRVHVSAARSNGSAGSGWLFSVKDNGLGIDPQYFERIFGMFQRLHKREEFAGTGIGLAICKKIVERHGGTIAVESSPGCGSTFSFALADGDETSSKEFGG